MARQHARHWNQRAFGSAYLRDWYLARTSARHFNMRRSETSTPRLSHSRLASTARGVGCWFQINCTSHLIRLWPSSAARDTRQRCAGSRASSIPRKGVRSCVSMASSYLERSRLNELVGSDVVAASDDCGNDYSFCGRPGVGCVAGALSNSRSDYYWGNYLSTAGFAAECHRVSPVDCVGTRQPNRWMVPH